MNIFTQDIMRKWQIILYLVGVKSNMMNKARPKPVLLELIKKLDIDLNISFSENL